MFLLPVIPAAEAYEFAEGYFSIVGRFNPPPIPLPIPPPIVGLFCAINDLEAVGSYLVFSS